MRGNIYTTTEVTISNDIGSVNKITSCNKIDRFTGNVMTSIITLRLFFCLIDLILYVPSTNFLLNSGRCSWVEPVLS